mmetsp:Transcript_27019/g.78842  ORF Transcript_27019/g.78842 Transcript_27019/m.78842 type:complete len:326 (-) Transcript_27019:303-1280(-)
MAAAARRCSPRTMPRAAPISPTPPRAPPPPHSGWAPATLGREGLAPSTSETTRRPPPALRRGRARAGQPPGEGGARSRSASLCSAASPSSATGGRSARCAPTARWAASTGCDASRWRGSSSATRSSTRWARAVSSSTRSCCRPAGQTSCHRRRSLPSRCRQRGDGSPRSAISSSPPPSSRSTPSSGSLACSPRTPSSPPSARPPRPARRGGAPTRCTHSAAGCASLRWSACCSSRRSGCCPRSGTGQCGAWAAPRGTLAGRAAGGSTCSTCRTSSRSPRPTRPSGGARATSGTSPTTCSSSSPRPSSRTPSSPARPPAGRCSPPL